MIHNLISKLKEHHWTFTLIGTDDLDVEGMVHDFVIDNHLSFKENPEETKAMFAREHRARRNYNACVRKDVEIDSR